MHNLFRTVSSKEPGKKGAAQGSRHRAQDTGPVFASSRQRAAKNSNVYVTKNSMLYAITKYLILMAARQNDKGNGRKMKLKIADFRLQIGDCGLWKA
jgi:hypothetical protein